MEANFLLGSDDAVKLDSLSGNTRDFGVVSYMLHQQNYIIFGINYKLGR